MKIPVSIPIYIAGLIINLCLLETKMFGGILGYFNVLWNRKGREKLK
jgi:hypothetical protein